MELDKPRPESSDLLTAASELSKLRPDGPYPVSGFVDRFGLLRTHDEYPTRESLTGIWQAAWELRQVTGLYVSLRKFSEKRRRSDGLRELQRTATEPWMVEWTRARGLTGKPPDVLALEWIADSMSKRLGALRSLRLSVKAAKPPTFELIGDGPDQMSRIFWRISREMGNNTDLRMCDLEDCHGFFLAEGKRKFCSDYCAMRSRNLRRRNVKGARR